MAKTLKTPCVQIALDLIDEVKTLLMVDRIPNNPSIIYEAGTPLIKQAGIGIVKKIKHASGNAFVIADLKTLDVGALEVQIAKNGEADAAICAGLAGAPTINSFVDEAKWQGVLSFIDMMGVTDPAKLLKSLKALPDGVSLHRGIDAELAGAERSWNIVRELKAAFPSVKLAVAGGINDKTAKDAFSAGADIVVVGRFVTGDADPGKAAQKLIDLVKA